MSQARRVWAVPVVFPVQSLPPASQLTRHPTWWTRSEPWRTRLRDLWYKWSAGRWGTHTGSERQQSAFGYREEIRFWGLLNKAKKSLQTFLRNLKFWHVMMPPDLEPGVLSFKTKTMCLIETPFLSKCKFVVSCSSCATTFYHCEIGDAFFFSVALDKAAKVYQGLSTHGVHSSKL